MLEKKIIPYNQNLKFLAGKLRKQGILSEVILWRYLKNKQLNGFRFFRQKPLDNYIVDFFCPDLMLAIEIDGITHGDKIFKDEERDKRLKHFGVTVLRFSDRNIKNNVGAVLGAIEDWIIKTHLCFNTPRPAEAGHPSLEGKYK